MRLTLFVLLLCVLAGCGKEEDFRSFITPQALERADRFMDAAIKGDKDAALKEVIPDMLTAKGEAYLTTTLNTIQAYHIISPTPFKVMFYTRNGEIYGERFGITYQVQTEKRWLLVNVSVDGVYKRVYGVTEVEFQEIPLPLEQLNAFSFKGKPIRHYLVLGLWLCISVLTLICLVLWLQTPMKKTWIKCLWLVFIMLGMAQFTFVWTSGQVMYNLLSLGLVVDITQQARYAPWQLSFHLPLGALLFLWRRKGLREAARLSQ